MSAFDEKGTKVFGAACTQSAKMIPWKKKKVENRHGGKDMQKKQEDWRKYLWQQNRKWGIFFLGALIVASIALSLLYIAIQKTEDGEKYYILKKYLGEDDCLVYGANSNAPPLRFVDSDGVYKGVVVDYMSQLALELGVEIRMEPYPWEEALEKLKNGETDFCDMFVNEEREKNYVFTDPIYNLRTSLVVREDSKFTVDDINSMQIATERGDYANQYMQKNYPGAQLVYVGNIEEGMEMLANAEVDAVVGDEPILSYYITEWTGISEFRMLSTALYEEPVVLAMPKTHQDLIPIINRVIREVNGQGQLEKIQQKWFGISTPLIQAEPEKRYIRIVLISGAALLLTIGFISLNNRSLKKMVRTRTRELETNRNELQLIFDSIPEYIAILDEERKVINANKGILRYAELPIEQCIGKPVQILFGKLQKEEVQNALEEALKQDGKQCKFKSGKDVYEMQTYHMEAPDMSILLTLRNITIDEVNKMQLLQSSKMLAVGQLAAGMAHQIRNPLSVIRLHTYMLHENISVDENGKRSLGYIDDSVKKANRIIDNVMNFWHISGNQFEKIGLYQIMESILQLHENGIKKKNIHTEIRCSKELYFICNQESLKHILENLVSNAIDAMDFDGKLILSGEKSGAEIIICCEDNGCGIPEECMENLFNPFFTTKDPGKGTGLGLFVVYSEVEKLSGEIKVESKVGTGTTFRICLPDIGRGGNAE